MNYMQAQRYLASVSSIGIVPGLDTIRGLLKELGNPQEKLRIIHIAGTNGKGSVGAYISYILAFSGYRVGRYISPAIVDDREKIQILETIIDAENEKEIRMSLIERDSVAKHISSIKNAIERMLQRGKKHPTPFEMETAMAFLEMWERKCDIVVLEAGMGGRLDATNIVNHVECSVLVSISMDHMEFLGNKLGEIAEEKAGIIKNNSMVVSSPQKPEVEKILREKAEEKHSEIIFAELKKAENVVHSMDGIDFVYVGERRRKVHLSLLGINQVENALTAMETVQVLKRKGYHITEKSIKEGFFRTVWPGRFEILKRQPLVLVDGAHNEAAAEKLAESIRMYIGKNRKGKTDVEVRCKPEKGDNQDELVDNLKDEAVSGGKLIYVFGIFKDKEVEKVIEKTAAMADIILTVTPDSPRGLSSDKLKEKVENFWRSIGRSGYTEDCGRVENGVKKALELAGKKDAVIIFGSLSLLHEISVLGCF